MKIRKIFLSIVILFIASFVLASCSIVRSLEKEIEVTFKIDGEEYFQKIGEETYSTKGIVTQYQNIKSPTIPTSYCPDGYKILGWTAYNPDKLDPASANFKQQYIGSGKMVHYMDIRDFAKNGKVTLNALIVDKNLIPVVYHYVVIAFYDKAATSGIDQSKMDTLYTNLVAYLRSEGVSEADIATIVIRGYTGNVGPSCGAIMDDGDVDIMFGWGSADNVIGIGGMKEEMLLETVSYSIDYNGAPKNRTIHRLTAKESVIKVMEYLKSDDCRALFHAA